MDDTEAMPAAPMMETEPAETKMGVSAAMDVLDEFHIRRADMERVYTALETLLEPAEESMPEEADDQPDDSEMMQAVFKKGPPDKSASA